LSPTGGYSWDNIQLDRVSLEYPAAALATAVSISSGSASSGSCCNRFILLRDFPYGADGRVWLTCTDSGNLVVLKLLNLNREDMVARTHDTRKLSTDECRKWSAIFDVPVQSVEFPVDGYDAVAMPYAFTCKEDPHTKERYFSAQLNPFVTADESDERYLKEPNIASLLATLDAETMAREAVDAFIAKRHVHMDVEWRHVAALPVWGTSTTSTGTTSTSTTSTSSSSSSRKKTSRAPTCADDLRVVGFRGIFIDLSDVQTLRSACMSAREAKSKMLAALGLDATAV
jgi:hypothetical protein